MEYKDLRGYLFFAIIGGFVAWMVWGQPKIDVDIKSYETQINILQQKIDSIQSKNSLLRLEADSLKSRVGQYDSIIANLNKQINDIQQETQKKLDSVDNLGGTELQQFFTDRYKNYINSKER